MNLHFIIPGTPVPKARARASKFGGKHRTPDKTRKYESLVASCAFAAVAKHRRAGGIWVQDVEYTIVIIAVFPDRRVRDLDNILKSILDGCNKVVWDDDRLVSSMSIKRVYDKGNPHTAVMIGQATT